MFAQLGSHIFKGLKTPQAWDETHAVKYGKIPIINSKDDLQFTGQELSEFKLTISYASDFCTPDTEVSALKQSMNDGEVLPFVSGAGEIIGDFVIKGLDINNERFDANGNRESCTVDITLLQASPQEDERTGAALKSANPIKEAPAPAIVSPANDIAKDISKAKNSVSGMKAVLGKIKKGTNSLKKGVKDVRKLADDVKQAYTTAKTKVEATKKIVKRASELPTSLDEAIKYAENLAKIDNVADMKVLEMNVQEMSDSADKVTKNSSQVISFSATKEGGN